MKVRAKPLLFPISITIKVDQLTRELLEKISEKRSVSISEATRFLIKMGAERLQASPQRAGENARRIY